MDKLCRYAQDVIQKPLNDTQLGQFEKYFEMLIEKNKVMNLTAITDREEVVLKHFIDSIALAQVYDLKDKEYKIIDVGTGAGFPGIPLKIVFPNLRITLFDSLNKRIRFLQEVIDELGFVDMEAIHGRAEDGGRSEGMREKYDIAVSRAVANMSVLSEYCMPFVRVGGYFIPYKTDKVDEELEQSRKAVEILGGKYERTEKIILPDSDIGRSFLFIKKKSRTPKAYPRKAGMASKQPL